MPSSAFKYKSADLCPDKDKHTKHPEGYIEFGDWADKKLKTHDQFKCPACGFWVIWKRK